MSLVFENLPAIVWLTDERVKNMYAFEDFAVRVEVCALIHFVEFVMNEVSRRERPTLWL